MEELGLGAEDEPDDDDNEEGMTAPKELDEAVGLVWCMTFKWNTRRQTNCKRFRNV